jgi:hypothetical protein
VDIAQIMQLLGQQGGGMPAGLLPALQQAGQGQPSPLGMLRPGRDPRGPGGGMGPLGHQFGGQFGEVAPPDFNAILYRQMQQEQQDRMNQMMQQRAMHGTLGAQGLQPPMPPQAAQPQPMPFQPPAPQPMTQPAGVASLPGGGLPSALGMAGQAGQRMAPAPRNVMPY